FRDAIARLGEAAIADRYGNLFQMYQRITAESPYRVPMRIYPAPHYTMGGLWVDYNLMSTIPGLHVIGEANFSDHGANRLGASAKICVLREEFWDDVYVGGRGADLNEALEQAGRVSDFLEFAELMCRDALERDESCGCHFREEYQTPEGEARRDDERFGYVAG